MDVKRISFAVSLVLGVILLTSCPDPYTSGGYVESPTISPPGGTFTSSVEVTIAGPDGAALYYTVDGEAPTTSSMPYTDPFTLDDSATVTAIATMGGRVSAPVTASFSFLSGDGGSDLSIAASFWGSWIRLDQPDIWYIGNTQVHINDDIHDPESCTSSQMELPGHTVAVFSDSMLEVDESGRVYYLHRDGDPGMAFTGRVVSVDGASASRSLAGVAGISVIIENLKNSEDIREVVTDGEGGFSVEDAIPGSTYEVVTDDEIPTQVEPVNDGESVGTISVTDASYKFKARPEYPEGVPFLFADGVIYDAGIRIRNNGTIMSPSPVYTLTAPPGMVVTTSLSNNMQTIVAGGERLIPFSFSVADLTEAWRDFLVDVVLEDTEGRTWEDQVSFRVYRSSLNVNVATDYAGYHIAVLTPEDRVVLLGDPEVIRVPSAVADYRLILSGATADSEMKYSLAFEEEPLDVSGLVLPNNHEPNGRESEAAVIGMQEAVSSYLAFNDLDFFRIDSSAPAIVYPGKDDLLWYGTPNLQWNVLPGAVGYQVQVSSDPEFGTVAVSTSVGRDVLNCRIPAQDLLPADDYYWRVRADLGNEFGSWNQRQFTRGVAESLATASGYGTYFLAMNGVLHTWGVHGNGAMGIGISSWEMDPDDTGVQVTLVPDAVYVSAGFDFGFAVDINKSVWQWGSLPFGYTNTPTKRDDLANVRQVAAGSEDSYALLEDGTVWSLGFDTDGHDAEQVSGLTNIVKISADHYGATYMALAADGTAYMWGRCGYDGQNQIIYSSPVEIPGVSQARDITAQFGVVTVVLGDSKIRYLMNDTDVWEEKTEGFTIEDIGFGNYDASARGFKYLGSDGLLYMWDRVNDTVRYTALENVEQVHFGFWNNIAVLENGEVYAWGTLDSNTLADGGPQVTSPGLVHGPGY